MGDSLPSPKAISTPYYRLGRMQILKSTYFAEQIEKEQGLIFKKADCRPLIYNGNAGISGQRPDGKRNKSRRL
jgi:hypothetical protein